MTFGEKLQLLRKSRGWTQEQLSAQINISRQALSKWESGAAIPDTENVIRLSRLFAVSTDYLLLDEYDEPMQSSPEKDCATISKKNTARFWRIIAGSTATGLSVIILLVWLYLCGNIIILGNVFNCVWYTRKKKRYLQRMKWERE